MSKSIVLEVTVLDQGQHSFKVRFFGPQAEDNALAYVERKDNGDYYFSDPEDEPVDAEFTRLIERLWPKCEHGMSANSCFGPQHYWMDDEERAHYGYF